MCIFYLTGEFEAIKLIELSQQIDNTKSKAEFVQLNGCSGSVVLS